ncbi:MAG: choice-of-anchor family protein [Microbacteriaceae bacterium]|nr:choice-of-anchor family protein [Microbacteriaceae bacterium]
MLTPHIPRAGKSDAHNSAPTSNTTRLKKAGAAASAVALGLGVILAAPLMASADTTTGSYAQGQFLSGTIAGTNLGDIVAITPATATNDGSQTSVTETNPLDVSVLNTVHLTGSNTDLNLNNVVNTGAAANGGVLPQYAEANNNGTATAASGAIGSNGAIGVGDQGNGGSATVSLQNLLGSNFGSVIGNLNLQLDAIAAHADGSSDAVAGTYRLDGAHLTFTSPALANLTSQVDTSLQPVESQLNGLASQLQGIGLNGLNLDGGSLANASVTATLSNDGSSLQNAVNSVLQSNYGSGGITLDPSTGTVTVDLAALHGGSLNNKPIDYELLSDAAVNQIVSGIETTVSSIADDVTNKTQSVLDGTTVDVAAHADALDSGLLGSSGVGGAVGGLLGGLGLGGSTSSSGSLASLDANVHGTIQQLLGGSGTATAGLTVAGLPPVSLDASPLLSTVGSILGPVGNGNAVSGLTSSLNSSIVAPLTASLTGDGGTNVQTVLGSLLSVRLNHQDVTMAGGGMAVPTNSLFTQTAVQVRAVPAAGSGTTLATINLAQATVGPNLPATVNPPGGPTCTVNCGTGGNPGNPSTPTASTSSGLAFTGVGIATIIAVILALLAAGAYLAREGYRRKHLSQL